MSDLLDVIKKRFLCCRIDAENIKQLERYEKEIASIDREALMAAIEALASRPAALIASIGADLEPIKIDAPVKFSCDRCGRCCSSYHIGISWSDITSYLQQGDAFIFPFITLPDDRPYYQLMTKREFLEEKSSFSMARLQEVEAINPSLADIPDHDLENCIFFNPLERACTIHAKKPLECKTYPAGNIVFNDKENACDAACFDQGERIDHAELARMLNQKRVPDYVLSILYGIAQTGGWRTDFFKIALLLQKSRSIP
ncbi:MAG: YkgJ family cysteine cluster protein [Candidatus Lokiarchaeota archaeon]|nr:YkgJ family cysteine cluster protein [Candidatus Lokiarchaeota archaeon]